MAKVILGTTMSLDGFINDLEGSLERLYPDLEAMQDYGPLKESIENTGATIMGRRAFDMAEDPDWYAGNYEYQMPIFVATHHVPERMTKEQGNLTFTFVTDGIESTIEKAKAAGGAQQCLKAGLADELHIDIMPILLGEGMRFFDFEGVEEMQLERVMVAGLPEGRVHMRFRVER